jgi:hypothetical protein
MKIHMRIVLQIMAALTAVVVLNAPASDAPALPAGVESAPFEIIGDRLFITAKLNDKAVCQALLDTGSEMTLLNRARVDVPDLHPAAMETAQGSFVGAMQVSSATLKKFAVGAHTLERVPIFTLNHGKGKKLEQIDLVLGMDLLGRSRFTVDFRNSRVLFWPPAAPLPHPDAGIERVQLAVRRGFREEVSIRPRIEAKLNGKITGLFLVDFGADTPLFVATKNFRDIGFAAADEPSGYIQAVNGDQNLTLSFYRQPWPKLELGAMAFEKIEGRVVAADRAGPVMREDLQTMYNILGTPFLKVFDAVHIDMPNKTVLFDRKKQP